MKLFSGDGIVMLSAAMLFTGIASATKTDEISTPNRQVSNAVYTASGTMTKKNALMLQNLLRNPYLRVKAQVGKQTASNPVYTANGTMTKKTALMLQNLLRNPHLKVQARVGKQTKQTRSNSVYTASGTMSKKTALMLQNLLRNPHLKVQALVGKQTTRRSNQPVDVAVNYTINGKTDRATVLKLKKMLQNSSNIKISAHANVTLPSQRVSQQMPYQPAFIGGYKPFYYNGNPPVYIQGNTIWYPVPVATIPKSSEKAPFPMDYSLEVAGK